MDTLTISMSNVALINTTTIINNTNKDWTIFVAHDHLFPSLAIIQSKPAIVYLSSRVTQYDLLQGTSIDVGTCVSSKILLAKSNNARWYLYRIFLEYGDELLINNCTDNIGLFQFKGC